MDTRHYHCCTLLVSVFVESNHKLLFPSYITMSPKSFSYFISATSNRSFERLQCAHYYTVWVKKNPPPLRGPDIFHFFHKRLRIFNRFFTHLLYVPIYARLQIFIQLSPILTKLCHIERDHPVYIICSKCPQSAEMHALTRLRKSLIALLIVVCGKSL